MQTNSSSVGRGRTDLHRRRGSSLCVHNRGSTDNGRCEDADGSRIQVTDGSDTDRVDLQVDVGAGVGAAKQNAVARWLSGLVFWVWTRCR